MHGMALPRSYLGLTAKGPQPRAMSPWLCRSHHFSQLLFCCQPASADLEAFLPLPFPPLLLLPKFEERA